MVAAFFTDVNALSAGRGKFEQFLVGQVIENDHLSPLEDFLASERKKTGIPGSGAHEIDFALFHVSSYPARFG